MKAKILTILGTSLLLGACTIPGVTEKKVENNSIPPKTEAETSESVDVESSVYSFAQIAEHATPEDCWFTIDGTVYDVTGFAPTHPGEEAVYQGCGKDATELFETRPMGSGAPHSQNARGMMAKFEIGTYSE